MLDYFSFKNNQPKAIESLYSGTEVVIEIRLKRRSLAFKGNERGHFLWIFHIHKNESNIVLDTIPPEGLNNL